MTKQYFKATDGQYTIFRASESRVYRSAWMRIDRARERSSDGKSWVPVGELFPVDMGFSAGLGKIGHHKAIEISKCEYDDLVALKTKRVEARREELSKRTGQEYFHRSVSPRDSWVRNADLVTDEMLQAFSFGPMKAQRDN